MLILRSILFYLGYVVSIILYGSLCLLTFFIPFRWRFNLIVSWVHFVMWWLKITCNIHYQVEGLKNIPTQNGIVLSKHQSSWETFFLNLYFRPLCGVLKKELLKFPFFGWTLYLLKPIAIDRGKPKIALKQILTQGTLRLQAGIWVMIFPEGTRVSDSLGSFNPGGAILSEKSGYPIVPVAHNAGKYWPAHQFIKYPGTIRVKIGPAIDPAAKSYKDINNEAKAWIEEAMGSLYI